MCSWKSSLLTGIIIGTGMALSLWLGEFIPGRNAAIVLSFIIGVGSCYLCVVREVMVILSRRKRP